MVEQFTEDEIRNSVGMAYDENETAYSNLKKVRQNYTKNLTENDVKNFRTWLKNYKYNRHRLEIKDHPVDECI